MAFCPGLPGWAGTRKVKPIWILLKQDTVSGSGISWAICKSAPRSRQTTRPAPQHSVFYRLDARPATQPTVSKLKWTQLTSVSTVHTQLRMKNAQCSLISAEKKPLANITNSNMNKTRSMNVSVDWQNIRHQQLTSVMSRDAAAALMCKLGWRTALVVSSARENVPTALSQQSFIHHYHYHQHHNSTSGRLDAR